ncbi:MAG: DUF1572 family protein [Longimicrobiales bacterium]
MGSPLFEDVAFVYRQQRKLAEAAAQQLDDTQFFHTLDPGSNSIAVIMKHVGGNLRSRWTHFLRSDGEKADRNRDGEFVAADESRDDIMRVWSEGWQALEATLASLTPADLEHTVTIRGEPHTVIQALLRNLAHSAHHAGQIVLLAKALARDEWRTLSIPRPGAERQLQNYWVR